MAKDSGGHGSEGNGGSKNLGPMSRFAMPNRPNMVGKSPAAQAISDWKNKGTSDQQVVTGIRALFGVSGAHAAAALAQGHAKSTAPGQKQTWDAKRGSYAKGFANGDNRTVGIVKKGVGVDHYQLSDPKKHVS